MRATELVHPEDRARVEAQLAALVQTVTVTEPIQFRVEHTDGTYRYAEAVVSNLRDNPSVAGYVGNLRDITERKEAESQLLHVALHDPLTGLPNRTLILDRADQMLVRARGASTGPWRRCSSTSTTSRTSTTPWATTPATRCSRPWRTGSSASCAKATRSGGSAATSSSSWPKGRRWGPGPEMVAERLHDVLREPFRIEGYDHGPSHRDRQHRHRRRAAQLGLGAAARRRHRPVPGQGTGQEPLGAVPARDADRRARPHRARGRPAHRPWPRSSSSSSTSPSSTSTT